MLVDDYLRDIGRLRRASPGQNEMVIREAFKDLLKACCRQRNLIFLAESRLRTTQRTDVRPDGTILQDLVPFGHWEAKDPKDRLDDEIAGKLRKGYPQDNIIFENSLRAVLIQNRRPVMDCTMTDRDELARLIDLFFGYQPPAVVEFREAVRKFQEHLPTILGQLRGEIDRTYRERPEFATRAAAFLDHAKQTINPTLTRTDVDEMLIQHILTEEIFTKVFDDGKYHRENNIARELSRLEDVFADRIRRQEMMAGMGGYYRAIAGAAAEIRGHGEKQAFLKLIYENFYKVYNPKAADRLGVVYTPNEIVRFMIDGADWLCRQHFGKALIDRGVEILDPATGTGTFICDLIDHFSGEPEKLRHKYREELHANEVAILPYYVANVNIEATYAAVAGQYAEFPNLCFVDTLDNVAGLGVRKGTTPDLFGALSDENVARVKRQNLRKISVVIGNPPYNAWQENFNQRNANRSYKKIDQRIKETYIQKGSAQNQNSVYDMYTRFFRWSADRVHDDGIIAFIVGRKPVAKGAYDGFRRDLADEFHEVYVVDLGGDAIDNPKLSGTKHNVFGNRSGVAIYFLVKKDRAPGCKVFYARRDEYDTKEDKLAWLGSTPMSQVKFERITPDKKGNWLGQTENDWEELLPVVSSEVKARKRGAGDRAIFKLFSNGLKSQRDEWVYDADRTALEAKVRYLVQTYEATRADPEFADRDTIKWDAELDRYAKRRRYYT
jgi:predicted helicase